MSRLLCLLLSVQAYKNPASDMLRTSIACKVCEGMLVRPARITVNQRWFAGSFRTTSKDFSTCTVWRAVAKDPMTSSRSTTIDMEQFPPERIR